MSKNQVQTETTLFGTTSATSSTIGVTLTPSTGVTTFSTVDTTTNIENAIYSHIQAMRSLGRTTINTLEIATALNLPLETVHSALTRLGNKGIKFP